jgi:hypothetical protein
MSSFVETLKRIILLKDGQTPAAPGVTVSTTQPQPSDSKEILALRWEKKLRTP